MIDGPLTLSPSDRDVSTVMSGFCFRRTAVTRALGSRAGCSGSSASAPTTIKEREPFRRAPMLPARRVRGDHHPPSVALQVDAREAQRAAGRLALVLDLGVAEPCRHRGVAVDAHGEVVLLHVGEELARAG